VTPEDFREYYTRWYVPSNITVLVVGDTDPAMVAEVIAKEFGSGPTVPKPTPRDVGVKPTVGQRAIVVTDPECPAPKCRLRGSSHPGARPHRGPEAA
jgi:Predicted Zn-dependent peptidases